MLGERIFDVEGVESNVREVEGLSLFYFGPPKSVCGLFKSDLALSITSYPDPNYPRFKKGFLVRDASTFSGLSNKYIRLAVRKRKENLAILEALNELNLEGTLGE